MARPFNKCVLPSAGGCSSRHTTLSKPVNVRLEGGGLKREARQGRRASSDSRKARVACASLLSGAEPPRSKEREGNARRELDGRIPQSSSSRILHPDLSQRTVVGYWLALDASKPPSHY